MPPKRRTVCKVEGCANPLHVYPSGWRCQYCKDHMHLRKSKQRGDQPSMSSQMRDVLRYLLDAKRADCPFMELRYPLAHGKTLNNLVDRDWIFESPGIDGLTKYKITGRGEDALKVYEKQLQRRDGICSRCNTQPRHVDSAGRKIAYCLDCERARNRDRRRRGAMVGDITRPCSRCKAAPRHLFPGGDYSSYCQECEIELRRLRARGERRRLFEAVQAGAPVPMCKVCKQKPRQVFRATVANCCVECQRKQVRTSKMRTAMRHVGVQP